MKSALVWFVAVMAVYVLMIWGAIALVPKPWTPLVAGLIVVLALRFALVVWRAARLGTNRKRGLPK